MAAEFRRRRLDLRLSLVARPRAPSTLEARARRSARSTLLDPAGDPEPAGSTAPPRPGGALVLGASYRALAVARSLGRAGITVAILRTDDHALAVSSRYARRRLGALSGEDASQRDALLSLADREGLDGWVLIPTADEDAAMVAREHEALSRRFALTTPPWSVLHLAYDKREVHALAARLGLPQPWTAVPAVEGGLDVTSLPYPAILKPAMKVEQNALTAAKAWRVNDPQELTLRWADACRLLDPAIVMVQQLIEGGEQLSFAALCREGEVLAELTARRTRQLPVDFGRASTFVETIDDASLRRDARPLLESMRFTGIVEVEYVRDPATHANLILDVNPRAWGWQSLCERAGVDFPLLLFRMAAGERVPYLRAAPGVRWVRLLTDVPAALAEWRLGRLDMREWLSSLRGPVEGAVFAPDDPLPAVLDVVLLLRLAAARLSRGEPL
jgi:predicted ATP-grasp superfamily ATP-dependent carboligase